MNLKAYLQIDDLYKIMHDNGIAVPRLRGLCLMSQEEPMTKQEIEKASKELALYYCENYCETFFSSWNPNPGWAVVSYRTDRLKKKYLYTKGYCVTGIQWNRIHGKRRKMFKYAFKAASKKVNKFKSTFNKYCGRDDVLCIHAKIGGNNWAFYDGAELEKQSWFIEKVDDYYDNTYCDIYARIKSIEEDSNGA